MISFFQSFSKSLLKAYEVISLDLGYIKMNTTT